MRLGRGMSLLLGGARSGKSDLAVRLGQAWPATVSFVATATAGDADMAERIERHQAERPLDWALVEAPLFCVDDVGALPADDLVIVDCITLLVANLLFDERSPADIESHIQALGNSLALRNAPTLVISNEVGLGIHPETPLGRSYRDLLGRANRLLADVADTTVLVVAGKALPLHDLNISW